jgi:hypothetical protein
MNRTILYAAVSAACFIQILSAGDKAGNPRHTIIVQSGDAAPAGGIFIPFSFLDITINERHTVAFDAFLTGPPFTSGVFVADGKTISTIALGLNPSPAGPSFESVLDPFITRDGAVVFLDGAGNVFRNNGKTIVPLVRIGDQAPVAGTVTLLGPHVVSEGGTVAYFADLNGAGATQAIFRTDGTRTVTIARDDIAPPTGGHFTALENLDINSFGQVAFNAEMSGGAADHGVFRGEGGSLTAIFAANQAAPGGGTIDDCSAVAINAHGQVMAGCSLKNTLSPQGVFVGDGIHAVAIALIGNQAPAGGNYDLIPVSKLNDRGQVAFKSRLTNGATGIFLGDGRRTTTLAVSGMNAPGTPGSFQSFGDLFVVGNGGRVVFTAKLAAGEGVDSSNNIGMWTGTSEKDLRLLVRTGDVIGGKVLTALPFDGSNAGHPLQMTENSVLWRGSFGLSKAVIVSEIPGEGDRGNEKDEYDRAAKRSLSQ